MQFWSLLRRGGGRGWAWPVTTEPGTTAGTGYLNENTGGTRPARPQRPGRPRLAQLASAPGLFASGNRLAFSQAARQTTEISGPNWGEERGSRRGFPVWRGVRGELGPGQAELKLSRRTHLSLRLPAGGTTVQTPRAASSACSLRASSLRARSRQIPIGCVLKTLTNTVAPWHLSPPPWVAGAGSPCAQSGTRVPKAQ